MEPSQNDDSPDVFDATPYLKLVIDKNGRWLQNGTEIIHPQVYRQFCAMLEHSPDGGYQVRMGREICRVEVEDAPFVVQRVEDLDDAGLSILLNDGTHERFDPERFWIGADNIPYCTVKQGRFHARFSRPAYYQIAQHVEQGEKESELFLVLGNRRIRIKGSD
jgi:hypothetical protein